MNTETKTKYYEFLEAYSEKESCMYLATKAFTREFEELSHKVANDILLDWIIDSGYNVMYLNRKSKEFKK